MGIFIRLLFLVILVQYTWLDCFEINVDDIVYEGKKYENKESSIPLHKCVPIPGLAFTHENMVKIACREISYITLTDLENLTCSVLPANPGYVCKEKGTFEDKKCEEIKNTLHRIRERL